MTNVMLLGDTHGNRGFTKSAISWAAANGIDRIVQVGDFGFWPRLNNGQKFLHDVGKAAVEAHVPLYFIDGNHEDHLYLDSIRSQRGVGMIHYGKYPITYIDRGTTWEWGGVTFGAFGGAYSIDRRWRTEDSPQYGWFANEMPDRSKIAALGEVDVLLTHDAPTIPPLAYGGGFKDDPTSRESQAAVYAAVVASQPMYVVHGHWHVRYDHRVGSSHVIGLGHDGGSLHDATIVYSTEDRLMYSLTGWEYRNVE